MRCEVHALHSVAFVLQLQLCMRLKVAVYYKHAIHKLLTTCNAEAVNHLQGWDDLQQQSQGLGNHSAKRDRLSKLLQLCLYKCAVQAGRFCHD